MTSKLNLISSSILLLIFFNPISAFAQTSFALSTEAKFLGSSQERLPFWMYSNQRGRISEDTNLAGWISGKANYNINPTSVLEVGGGILYSDGFTDEVVLDELYAQFTNAWLQVVVGRKQRRELYNGLSATNENILWSLNARPLPGLQIQTVEPVFLGKQEKLGIEASWDEFLMGDDRFVKNARLHHKSLHLLYRTENGWEFKAGIQHFVQWAGTSPDFGKQPDSFTDYLRVVTGRGGAEGARQGDVENALGNHLGSWEIYITKKTGDVSTQFIYNNIFEDGSGSRLANFPDGRYGIFVETVDENRWLHSFIYEFYTTMDQSHDVNMWGADNYLGHFLMYNSGWAYRDQVLGAPFFLYDGKNDRVINNKFAAHHIGLGGNFFTPYGSHPYKLLFSYSHNEGTFYSELNPKGIDEDVLYMYSKTRIINRPFQIDLEAGADFNSVNKPVFGAGIHLVKKF